MKPVAQVEVVRALLDLLYPPMQRCLVCDRMLPEKKADWVAPGLCPSCHLLMTKHPEVCPLCRAELPPIPKQQGGDFRHLCEPGEGGIVHYAGVDRHPLSSLVCRFRQKQGGHLVHTLAHLMAEPLRPITGSGHGWALVPVPPWKGRPPDLDRCLLLARRTAENLGAEWLDVLRWRSEPRGTAGRPWDRDSRLDCVRSIGTGVKNLIVVDDTYTTGRVLRAATAALRKRFPGSVRSAVIAARGSDAPEWFLGSTQCIISWRKQDH